MNPTFSLFNSARVNGILQPIIRDPRLLPQKPIWESRIPDVQAAEEEIMARFYGQLLIADLVADDAKAGVYSQGTFQFENGKVPNIKMGIAMNQSTINILQRLQQYNMNQFDLSMFNNWQADALMRAVSGVKQRKEVLRVAMLLDGLTYDRLGVKMNNVTWGMYPDLKVTVGTAWDNVNATGLTDIQTLRRTARVRYGKVYNRATMSTPALQNLAKQNEFIAQVKAFGFGFGGIPVPGIPLQNDAMLKSLIEKVIAGTDGGSFTIEIDDRRVWSQDSTGLITNAPIQPINAVVLTDSADDGNTAVWDFAQGVVTESIVANIVPNLIGSLPIGYGPMGYVTATTADLNPAGITHWAVDRGFPRKKDLAASAVLTVGTFSDTISTAVTFPQ